MDIQRILGIRKAWKMRLNRYKSKFERTTNFNEKLYVTGLRLTDSFTQSHS